MKNNVFIHVVGWGLLLLIPYLTGYEHLRTFANRDDGITLWPVVVISAINIVIFYINYNYLIPRFLFARKYVGYCFLLSIGLASSYALSFSRLGVNQSADPISNVIQHTAKANTFQMLIVSLAASLALAYSNRIKKIEHEKLSAQIASLKAQINPHFLYNALNNIYATALDTSPKTADMVEKLSEMMRYAMKETKNDFVMLEDELNYINNYVQLQELRSDDSITINYNNAIGDTSLQIAPMLLIPLVENAFKHGTTPIKIDLTLQKTDLHLFVANNKGEINKGDGLGLKNTKDRLLLIYPNLHNLSIEESDRSFEVSLKISLS